jgi:hypothetical protein
MPFLNILSLTLTNRTHEVMVCSTLYTRLTREKTHVAWSIERLLGAAWDIDGLLGKRKGN